MIRYLSVFAVLACAAPAAAQPVCIVCNAPDVTYRCEVQSGGLAVEARAASMFCMTNIAEEHAHSSCAAVKGDCDGVPKIYTAGELNLRPPRAAPEPEAAAGPPLLLAPETQPGYLPPPETLVEAGPPLPPLDDPAAAPQAGSDWAPRPDGEEPPTLVDVTREAMKNSGETMQQAGEAVGDALKNTGQAVGDAAKKTWNCVGSALQDCR